MATSTGGTSNFELVLNKEDFKFSAAHFVAHNGGRERLHGHNYRLKVTIIGDLGADGYVIDFGEAKKSIRAVCKELDELFLLPMHSSSTSYSVSPGPVGDVVILTVLRDGTSFTFPAQDVAMLPIANSTVEELSRMLAGRLVQRMGKALLQERHVHAVSVSVSESPGQEAAYTIRV